MPKAQSSGSNTSFRPCPDGTAQAVLVDVIDLGMITSTYNGETKTAHKVNFVWQVDERKDDGTRFLVFQRLTNSLHPKATLRKVVDTLLGRKLSDDEAQAGVELDDLKGKNALLTIIHNAVGDRIYANVQTVAGLMKGMKPIKAEDYERRAPKSKDDGDVPF